MSTVSKLQDDHPQLARIVHRVHGVLPDLITPLAIG